MIGTTLLLSPVVASLIVLGRTDPQCSVGLLVSSYVAATASPTSATNPTTIAQAPHSARLSLIDISKSSLAGSWLLISPYRRRGKGPHPASAVLVGILLSVLIVLL